MSLKKKIIEKKNENTDEIINENKTVENKDKNTNLNKNIINIQNEEIDSKKYPLCFKIIDFEKKNKNIFESDGVQFSENINYPKFEYGFHHFIHQSKNYLNDETKKFEGKKKVWNVLNKYETIIDNYTQSITDISKIYYESISKIEIINDSFYKLWELFLYHNLINLEEKNFVSAHICDKMGGFTQATIYYRNMFSKISNSDKNYVINLNENEIKNVFIQELDKKFVDFYEKEKKIYVVKSNGTIKEKCNLVTANGGFQNMNENLQEQESPALLLYEILSAIKILKKNGNFVCKFFETFTEISIKIITILSNLFNEIYFTKPLLSKLSNCEKYAICLNFKYDENDKDLTKIILKLENIIGSIIKNKDNNVVDIFLNFKIPRELIISVTNMNIIFSNQHLKNINNIVTFIRNQIYSGEEYHDNRNEQIEGTKYWIDIFFPKANDINKAKDKAQILINKTLNIVENNKKILNESLIQII
jgi:23S rRNA U2552 (ribose-2'-O)-methylase RlmE/FtsJ